MKLYLQENDIMIFKNGKRKYFGYKDDWVIKEFYDDELNCKTNDDLSIVKVLRPEYKEIYNKESNKTLVKSIDNTK